MGANLPPPHRCFNMRNPFARIVLLAVAAVFIVFLMIRSDAIDVRAAILKTAKGAKEADSSQHPLHGQSNDVTGTKETTDSAGSSYTNSSRPFIMSCDYDMSRLQELQEKYGLQTKFEYTKRYVRISRQDIQRKSVTKLDQVFMPDSVKVIDLKKQYKMETCPEPLAVPVTRSPFPSNANASDFIFGVSTTYNRFTDPATSSINEWTYWLTDGRGHSNGGKLILMLLGAAERELEDAYSRLSAVGIDVDVYQSDPSMEMAVRYLTLVPKLYNHPDRKGRKWIVTCDDDTFFPSFNALVARFEEFDHEQPMYIGTLSEDVNNIERHGSQAFGGAGVFLSTPLAKMIADKYESCKVDEKIKESNTGWGPQGDILLRKCIYDNSEVKLTVLPDLWQLDLYGDPSGFYESGIKPLSLHHYRGGGWHIAFPWQTTKVAHLCGEDCSLQRFRTRDDFVISNGFSIAYYPKGIDFDMSQFERTFNPAPRDKGWNLDLRFGPQRKSLHKTGRKISWDLQESTVNDDGGVSQIYVRKSDDWRWRTKNDEPMSDLDGIIELVWIS